MEAAFGVIIRHFKSYFWAGAVVLVFVAINVGVATDHLRIQLGTTRQTVSSLEGAKLLAGQRAALLAARRDNGPLDLQMMRKAGIRVPDSFIRDGKFASPWGRSDLRKDGAQLVWDFHEITTSGCMDLLGAAIPGVIRAAASGGAADERPAPLARELAVHECRRTPLMARLILQ